ncbi:quinolinate synthase NadA [uncultured Pseudodesulfovibrio sp.]|uniref:quinolinate synthase NadA n=1 Tax=uncultured Pseudodesulfovibrio sp. TaxID=2035858 RepID=UPI0029C61F59|nr:quinolinate synthase NadA [uncultured Pseudodesulfovibrio sp.]
MEKFAETIETVRKKMGSRLAILGHHYQADAVMAHTDIRGDSLELSRHISGLDAEHIVFCGVYFMAESAAILRREDQKIHIPDPTATCPMADMAEAGRVRQTLDILQADGRKIIPLTYVNSSAAVKGVVGEYDGSVCTSANAETMLSWAMKQGDAVLFLPDKHLATNTANTLNIPKDKRIILPAGVIDGDPKLFINPDNVKDKEFIIWPGYCPIHEEFQLETVETIRAEEPDAKIVVHPECDSSVVDASDGHGSTTFLIKYAKEAPAGSTVYIGTEENLVKRLAAQYAGEKTIRPLNVSLCEDMGKTTEENLAALLENIDKATPIDVPDDIKAPARLSLERMLEVCSR